MLYNAQTDFLAHTTGCALGIMITSIDFREKTMGGTVWILRYRPFSVAGQFAGRFSSQISALSRKSTDFA